MRTFAGLALGVVGVGAAIVALWPRPARTTGDRQVHVPASQPAGIIYRTDQGLEPDTCVSAWILSRRVSPGARIVVGDPVPGATEFDVAGAALSRQPGKCVSHVICDRYQIGEPFALAVMQVAQELELTPWSLNPDPFFERVRAGLGDAVNVSKVDQVCMDHALAFLDELERDKSSHGQVNAPATRPADR